jgi:hypothetical protein
MPAYVVQAPGLVAVHEGAPCIGKRRLHIDQKHLQPVLSRPACAMTLSVARCELSEPSTASSSRTVAFPIGGVGRLAWIPAATPQQ